MSEWIALFRGINVGGKNKLPMKDLIVALEQLGAANVRTYIQSGNAVFEARKTDAERLSREIRACIEKRHGFAPHVLLLRRVELERAAGGNPFPEAEPEPKTLHVGFLAATPDAPDLEALTGLKRDSEQFHLAGRAFYLHAPEGIARSKLAAGAEKLIGVPMTMRNWRTVGKIRDLAHGVR